MFACGMESSAVAVVTDERDWTEVQFYTWRAQDEDKPHWWPIILGKTHYSTKPL